MGRQQEARRTSKVEGFQTQALRHERGRQAAIVRNDEEALGGPEEVESCLTLLEYPPLDSPAFLVGISQFCTH